MDTLPSDDVCICLIYGGFVGRILVLIQLVIAGLLYSPAFRCPLATTFTAPWGGFFKFNF